jgi:hypothetical protein
MSSCSVTKTIKNFFFVVSTTLIFSLLPLLSIIPLQFTQTITLYAATSTLNPGTTTGIGDSGTSCTNTGGNWGNTGNGASSNDAYITFGGNFFDSNEISDELAFSNFSFSLPSGSTVDGITVDIEKHVSGASDGAVDQDIRLTKTAGVQVGSNKADTVTDWPASDPNSYTSYGGSGDLWGTTWTEAEVEASGFGVVLCVKATSNNTDLNVDHVRITITYTPPTTTLGDGSDPSNVTLAPGASVVDLDAFTLQTNTGNDTVTAITVTLSPSNSFDNISKAEITNSSNVDQCTDIDNPSGLTLNFTGCSLSVSTSPTSFKVRITPKSHANMPTPDGASYAITGTVTSITATNSASGTDTDSATVTIDNNSPDNVTGASVSPGDSQTSLVWTNPVDSDFSEVIILRRESSAVTDTPTEGTNYNMDDVIGNSIVVCVTSSQLCTDSNLTNGTEYHYKIFAKDDKRNYSESGITPSGSPATPTPGDPEITQLHYRWRSDSGSEISAPYGVAEDVPITASNTNIRVGDRIRLRFVLSNTGTAAAPDYTYQLEYASSSCSQWTAVAANSSDALHWKMSLTEEVQDSSATTNSSGISDPVGKNFTSGYFKSVTPTAPAKTVASSEFTEYEFSIRSTSNAAAGLTYCFRVTDAGLTEKFVYSVEPSLLLTSVRRPEKAPPGVELPVGAQQRGGGNKKNTPPSVEDGGSGSQQSGGGQGGGGGSVEGAFSSWFGEIISALASAQKALIGILTSLEEK